MNTKTIALLAITLMFIACQSSEKKATNHTSPNENNQVEAMNSMKIHKKIGLFSARVLRANGKEMAERLKQMKGTDAMKDLDIPRALVLEKEFALLLLRTLDSQGGSGGLILYPLINPSGAFSLGVVAAKFPTDANGQMLGNELEVIYPKDASGSSFIYEYIRPVPPKVVTNNSDLVEN